ncbi:hypothetical protein EZS27_008029 [termite gut metagenome]|uniref:BIG2 domain-containing protein n=1 Tax=termite gut metagenome TaxID=433724 RepID=A0A5J4SGF6_9ZZZZ
MKTKTIFLSAMSMLLALFIFSCSSSDDENNNDDVAVTGITLDQETASVDVEATITLTATLEPAGANGSITWSSSDSEVAVVTNGVVTGITQGTTTIAAACGAFSATCEVTVTPKPLSTSQFPSLQGSDYYVISLSESAFEAIKSKVTIDFRPDEVNKNLFVWSGTFSGGTPVGPNFYEEPEGWVSLVVANTDWSGAGYAIGPEFGTIDMTKLAASPEDYYFHIALKSAQPEIAYTFIFAVDKITDDKAMEVKIVIGNAPGDNDILPSYNFERDNEWHEFEIPITKFIELQPGAFQNPFVDANIFAFLAGGGIGKTLDMDAVFFYKKAN